MRRSIEVSHLSFILGLAVFFVLGQNIAFWQQTLAAIQVTGIKQYLLLASVAIFLFCFVSLCFLVLLWQPFSKALAAIFIVFSSLANYYFLQYNIYFDSVMLSNIIETNPSEAGSLITSKLLIWLFFTALIPCALLFFIKIKAQPRKLKFLFYRLAILALLFPLCAAVVYPFYAEYASIGRNHHSLVKLIMPSNLLNSGYAYGKENFSQPQPFQTLGEDATLVANDKKQLFILVLGETSRAQNFQLNGYPQATNPKLSQVTDLINFPEVSSCGTATAVSVPCMFSNLTRAQYSAAQAKNQENILDIIQRAGYRVLWRENDGGCKGVCARVPSQKVKEYANEAPPAAELYYDQLLLQDLDSYIAQQTTNTFIVLHTNGSHGPEYYKRYQPSMAGKFSPECLTNAIETCSSEELINTYDNTILNVDDVLNSSIELLKKYQDQYQVSLLYVSDHGESLGEKGLYLHSAPYALSREQTHIPMLFWADASFYQNHQLDTACLKQAAQQQAYSHDNLFHSLLGGLNIQSHVYDASLDLFSSCKKP